MSHHITPIFVVAFCYFYKMKYYFVAGEASGDLHASKVIDELKSLDSNAEFRGWGGDKMESAGMTLNEHYRNTSFMGFVEVVKNLRTILDLLNKCKNDILEYQPDVLVLVDYPGFNLRIAEWAFKRKLKIYYFISPQIWAWKENRIHKIKKFIDKMFVILPFEKTFYAKWDYKVDFVGHPLLDEVAIQDYPSKKTFLQENNLEGKPIVALLPGSRKQEIKKMLPIMAAIASNFPTHQFVIAAAPNIEKEFYHSLLLDQKVSIVKDSTYPLLNNAAAALVTSGTATLETALFETPQIVCYKGNPVSYHIGKKLIKVKYISLVNLILGEELVTELIQNDLNGERLTEELLSILNDSNKKATIAEGYKRLKQKLGGWGASKKTAELIFKYLSNS